MCSLYVLPLDKNQERYAFSFNGLLALLVAHLAVYAALATGTNFVACALWCAALHLPTRGSLLYSWGRGAMVV